MANKLIKDETLTSIADEIRTLSGTTDAMSTTEIINILQAANETIATQATLIEQLAEALQNKAKSAAVMSLRRGGEETNVTTI